ncbi:MAG: hypothetical protein WC798_03830 [Candidatus Paceibacterota bacterium]|jgi:hypothetical protein
MSWAARRRFIILLIIGAVAVAFLAIVLIATFYKTPSCTDGVQNQGEAGVDCGGSCAYLCTAQVEPPVVLFTKALDTGTGRTDVVAMVENKNKNAAARKVPYSITLYGEGQVFLQEVTGTLDLPPGVRVPLFVPGVVSGRQEVTGAFLDIAADAPRWFAVAGDSRVLPVVSDTTRSGSLGAPRIDAVLMNPSARALSNVHVIVLVRNARKEVIAASETIVPSIPADGRATALFTWNRAFASLPTLIEVFPVIPLL